MNLKLVSKKLKKTIKLIQLLLLLVMKFIFKIFFLKIIVILSFNQLSYASTNNEAYKAVTAAQKCYRSLPSHFQKGSILDMIYNARKYYVDGSKYEKMGRSDFSKSYYRTAIQYSNALRRSGRAVGSKVC